MTARISVSRIALLMFCAAQPSMACLDGWAQTPTVAPMEGQTAGLGTDAQTSDGKSFKEDWPGQADAYYGFIMYVGAPEASNPATSDSVAAHLRTGYWVKLLGIRDDEEQAMRTIMAGAALQIIGVSTELWSNAHDGNKSPAEKDARDKILGQLSPMISRDIIVKLRREFGPEDFRKLDAYVERIEGYPHKITAVHTPSHGSNAIPSAEKAPPGVKQ